MKVLAVGDLHRKWGYVERILWWAKQNGYKKVVFTGDYADDFSGSYKDTFKLWDLMLNPPKGYKRMVVPLMGNHDYAYAHAVEMKALFGFNDVQTGFDNNTLRHLDIPKMMELDNKFHLVIAIDGVTYSHAGYTSDWIENVQKDKQYGDDKLPFANERRLFCDQMSPLWARYTPEPTPTFYALQCPKQVFGHTPVKTCQEFEDGCWCIDTFSTNRFGNPIGDHSLLSIEDGTLFKVIPEEVWNGGKNE